MSGDSAGCVRRDFAETGRCPLAVLLSNGLSSWEADTGVIMTLTSEGERRRRRGRHRQGVGARLPAAGGVAPPRTPTPWVAPQPVVAKSDRDERAAKQDGFRRCRAHAYVDGRPTEGPSQGSA
jgi:hypothetical protein